MDLTHDQLERHLCEIFDNSRLIYINDTWFELKHPTNRITLMANTIYDKAYKDALSDGILSLEDLEVLIKKRNLFTEDEQAKLDKLESQLEAQEVLLSKTVVVKANQDRIKKIIDDLKIQIQELRNKKTSKLLMSAESKAQEEKSLFLCSQCVYVDEKLYWKLYDDLLKETNLTLKDKVLIKFLKFIGGIDTTTIRYMARSNLWRIRFITSQKASEALFGVPTSQYTADMLNLAYWSNFYQNIYEMLPEDRPSDLVIDDDDALDAYMRSYYDERNKEDAARRSKNRTQGKLSAFDKEEVIVTQSNELYEDIKYDKPREAQRIKDKTDIKKRTRRV